MNEPCLLLIEPFVDILRRSTLWILWHHLAIDLNEGCVSSLFGATVNFIYEVSLPLFAIMFMLCGGVLGSMDENLLVLCTIHVRLAEREPLLKLGPVSVVTAGF